MHVEGIGSSVQRERSPISPNVLRHLFGSMVWEFRGQGVGVRVSGVR